MRRLALFALPLVLAAVALTVTGTGGSAVGGSGAAAASCAKADLATVSDGKLTVGTDNPAYPPWYAGGTPKGSKWKINDPATGKGFESAVAYAVAKQLGFSRSEVTWAYTPFNRAFAPGKKGFDFDINQISYTPQRAKVVDFSDSYYDVNQAVVVVKGTKIASVRSVAGLREVQARRADRHDELRRDRQSDQAVVEAVGLRHERQGRRSR